jgi:hypothetical protein
MAFGSLVLLWLNLVATLDIWLVGLSPGHQGTRRENISTSCNSNSMAMMMSRTSVSAMI